jgi:hypothetical protein
MLDKTNNNSVYLVVHRIYPCLEIIFDKQIFKVHHLTWDSQTLQSTGSYLPFLDMGTILTGDTITTGSGLLLAVPLFGCGELGGLPSLICGGDIGGVSNTN